MMASVTGEVAPPATREEGPAEEGGNMLRQATLVIVVCLAAALVPGSALGAAPFTPGSAGLGDPYFPLDGNGGYDVGHYGLDVTYDPATDVLTGIATITARATQNLSRFNLDFDGLTIRSIKVNGRNAAWSRAAAELTITPSRGIERGDRFTVVVRYDGIPQTLVDLSGTSGFIHTDDGALVVGQPHVAATWYPVNDYPTDKASYTFNIRVPAGLKVVANGELTGHSTRGAWTTWTWNAEEPMSSYLAGMSIGRLDVTSYRADGIKFWDAMDPGLFADRVPAVTPTTGSQLLYSQIGEPAYKRLTRVIDVPAGGATLSFKVARDTEPTWDFLFVESRTAGGTNWTTLPDTNGHTSQDVGSCPGPLDANPFLLHYLTPTPAAARDTTGTPPCDPTGTTGEWNAASGSGDGWETWSVALPNTGASPVATEVSITYASDRNVQLRGVALDDLVVSTGAGTTSFESDGDVLDGWTTPEAPAGSDPNPNTWAQAPLVAAVPGFGVVAKASLAREAEILRFLGTKFGRYPFSASGGIVDQADIFFALENQTRPIYSPLFFNTAGEGDSVIAHELAHQWYGDSLALARWQDIWLNEGFATYAEWMWSEDQGLGTTQEIYDFYAGLPADHPFWSLVIGDPGPVQLFDFPVYARGAMTLHALRHEVGDTAFFTILRQWARRHRGGNVSTPQFIQLAEQISHRDLGPLFQQWLYTGSKPAMAASVRRQASRSLKGAPAAVRNLVIRLKNQSTVPFE